MMNNLFGRQKLYTSLNEKQLNAESIGKVLGGILLQHNINASAIKYLRDVDKGKQDILNRSKSRNSNIENKIVENYINHAISFKKSYVFGHPMQYIQITNDKESLPPNSKIGEGKGFEKTLAKDLGYINEMMRYNSKPSKDIKLADDLYVAGVGVRMVVANPTGSIKPFEIHNLRPEQSAVVYGTDFKETPLFAFYIGTRASASDVKKEETVIKVYTKKFIYEYIVSGVGGDGLTANSDVTPVPVYQPMEEKLKEVNVLGFIPIYEYELNESRVSVTERMLTAQNALNTLTSSEVDDVEQFVESLIVFINADVDEKVMQSVKESGAINIKSNSKLESDVKMLTSKMKHGDNKILYDRILNNALINNGVPLVNVGGGGGDTGVARLTDNGWLMADAKAREDELAFVESEKRMLIDIIEFLKSRELVTDIEIYNIETKFTRNKSDNLLVKVQALQGLEGLMHPEDAFAIVDLVSDSAEAVSKAISYYGETEFFRRQNKADNVDIKEDMDIDEQPNEDLMK